MGSVMIEKIRDAIERVCESGRVTADGKPAVKALAEELGQDVSADERDAWWAELAQADQAGSLIYLGPPIVGVLVPTGAKFREGEQPQPLAEAVEANPDLAKLIVPAENAGALTAALQTPGTEEAELYRAASKALKR